jgi:hypothetical protein
MCTTASGFAARTVAFLMTYLSGSAGLSFRGVKGLASRQAAHRALAAVLDNE